MYILPRITASYQTDDLFPILTFPIMEAEDATNVQLKEGLDDLNGIHLVDGFTFEKKKDWGK
jgi:hypothetical protein